MLVINGCLIISKILSFFENEKFNAELLDKLDIIEWSNIKEIRW